MSTTVPDKKNAVGAAAGARNLAIYLAACLFVGFGLFPLYMMITTSLKTDQQTFAWPPVWLFTPRFQSYYNALFVFGGRSADHYLFNSLVVTLSSSALAVFLGAMAAYGLARFRFRGNRDVAFYILSTRFAPPVGFIVPIYLMVQRSGLLDTQIALIVVYTSMNLSFVTWILRGFFLEIPIEIEEAALVDGYTRWQIFLRVALPLVRPGLAATAILSAIFSWNEFLFASILAPGDAATIPVYLAGFSASMNIDWGEYMAVGTMAVLPIMIFTLALQRHLVRGLTFGAVR
ncbi:MAG: carbohydrate ABC transporter permease [Methylobacteriaceae bacterium]|nr:carbohydrate ABC transporter permease [Methylobacteriaceae bacterium]MBV9244522.1 carbohydrate ABC transporter permease [Methylobacteriaceae bacterium]